MHGAARMKRQVTGAVCALMLGGAFAEAGQQQQAFPSALTGVWVSGEGASGRPRTMTISGEGRVVSEFKGDLAPEVESRATISGEALLISDERGPEKCDAATEPGRYSYTLAANQLTLKAESDDKCPGRSRFYSRVWTKQAR